MTLQRKIDWVNGEQPGVLAYDTEGYRVLLDGNPAALSLCDALGNELERATQADITATQHIDGGTYESVIEAMRADADRIARGTEGAIASVLGGLDLDAPASMPEPAKTVLEAAPDGLVDDIGDQIEDTTDAIGTLSTNMSETYEETIDQIDSPQIDTPSEMPEINAEVTLDDIPSMDSLNEGSEDIEQAVAKLADEVNDTPQSETLSGTAATTLMGSAALVGGAMLGQSEENIEAEIEEEAPTDTPAEKTQQTAQAAGFISLSGLASSNNGFVTPVITETVATGEAAQIAPVAETIEATPEPSDIANESDLANIPNLSAETIEAPTPATPEDEIIAKLDEFIEPEIPAEMVTTPDLASETDPEYIAPDMPAPVSPADLSPEDVVKAPVAPPAPEETEAEAEETSEKVLNKRFNPWI